MLPNISFSVQQQLNYHITEKFFYKSVTATTHLDIMW